jgi:hypothetical protein
MSESGQLRSIPHRAEIGCSGFIADLRTGVLGELLRGSSPATAGVVRGLPVYSMLSYLRRGRVSG